MPSLQYLQGCAFALLSFADVRREHGSSLSLAVQLHWIREQEVLCPLPSLRVAGLPRYDAVLVRHHHGVLSLLCHDIQTALRRSVVAPLRLHRSVLMAFSVSLCLFFFGGFHLWLVLHDKTTLESTSCFRQLLSRPPRRLCARVPYRKNWCSVMDDSPWIVWLTVSVHRSGSSPSTAGRLPSPGISCARRQSEVCE